MTSEFWRRVEEWRIGLGLSQEEFCRTYLGVTRQWYAQLRAGDAAPSAETIKRILLARPDLQTLWLYGSEDVDGATPDGQDAASAA